MTANISKLRLENGVDDKFSPGISNLFLDIDTQ